MPSDGKNIMKFGLQINAPFKNTEDINYDTFGPHVLLQISDKKKQIIVFSERGRSNEHPW
jgi:hypothetical protein